MIDSASLLRPPALAPGDRLAAVTLSWGGPGTFPSRYEAGVRQLETTFGVGVVEMAHTRADPEWIASHPEARAEDLMAAFADPTIKGIVSTIGGDDSIRLLPYLNLDLIRSHPKVLIGYSDTTITHMALLRAGLVSFYGPSIMSGFAENGGMHAYTEEGVRAALFDPSAQTVCPENHDGWTVEHLDWSDAANQNRVRALQPSTGWRWSGEGTVRGPMVAGCLEVLDWLRGTEWWPDLDGAVVALETSEDAPPPSVVAGFLRSLAAMGDLSRLAAVLVGRPGGASLPVADHKRYDDAIMSVIRGEAGLTSVPIVTGMDVGHTDPMWTLAEGVPVEVDVTAQSIRLVEPGVVAYTSGPH
jgi:muramoyltetrapeptide carboxypeptidase LdcA involved in peptidoglycan recycling